MDQKLLFLINREWTSPGLDRLMAIMSSAAFWTIPLAVIALAAGIWGGFRGRAFVVVALVAFGLSDGVIGRTLKKVVGRPRPNQTEAGVRMIDLASPAWQNVASPLKMKASKGGDPSQRGGSFPSNHSANTAAVAMAAALLWRRWGWLAFVPALTVAYSRVYVGAHWPTDSLAGIGIGALTALLVFFLADWAWRRWAPRFAPQTATSHPTLRHA